jgi:hypothetical protein
MEGEFAALAEASLKNLWGQSEPPRPIRSIGS